MTKGKRQNLTLEQIIDLFQFMIDHELSQLDLAKLCDVYPSTIVRWKEKLNPDAIELYQQLQELADEKNNKTACVDVEKRTYDIAQAVIKHRLNLKDAIAFCKYDVSRSRVSHDLKKYLDDEIYSEVKKVLDTLNIETFISNKKRHRQKKQEKTKPKSAITSINKKKKSVRDIEKERTAFACATDIVKYDMTLSQTAQKHHMAKTTMISWIHKFVPLEYPELYQQFLYHMELQNKHILTPEEEARKQKETLSIAYCILQHPELSFDKIIATYFPYTSRTQAIRYIYDGLYKLDTTPNKILYLTVMQEIAKFDRRSPKYSKAKRIVQELEQEMGNQELNLSVPRNVEKRILVATTRIINGKPSSLVAHDMKIDETEMLSSIEEILPLIDEQLYQMYQIKTNVIDSESKSTLKLTK